jgi:hypothetical protein
MKKQIIAASLILASLAGISVYCHQYASVRHPSIEKVKDGWNFTYDLCVPAPMPMHCIATRRIIYVPKGYKSAILPDPKRLKSVDTRTDAREEAEKVADMVEGKYKGEPDDQKPSHIP